MRRMTPSEPAFRANAPWTPGSKTRSYRPDRTWTKLLAQPGDRRPIAARDWQPIQAAAATLVRAQASPNAISVAGMVSACIGGFLLAETARAPAAAWLLFLAGALCVQLRLLANVLDGMVAVGRGVASPVGELYNEVPDRISDAVILVGLGYAALDPALGLLAALLAMLTAYIRTTGRAAGAPSDFRGRWPSSNAWPSSPPSPCSVPSPR